MLLHQQADSLSTAPPVATLLGVGVVAAAGDAFSPVEEARLAAAALAAAIAAGAGAVALVALWL